MKHVLCSPSEVEQLKMTKLNATETARRYFITPTNDSYASLEIDKPSKTRRLKKAVHSVNKINSKNNGFKHNIARALFTCGPTSSLIQSPKRQCCGDQAQHLKAHHLGQYETCGVVFEIQASYSPRPYHTFHLANPWSSEGSVRSYWASEVVIICFGLNTI